MSADGDKALIVGGGIGGLAAALALRRIGWRPLVFERAAELREVGAGLGLWSNAINALRALDVADAVVARGSAFACMRMLTPAGRVLAEMPVGDLARRFGAVSLCIHRADLQLCLADALGAESLRTGALCVGFEEDAGGATALFAGGKRERGALLVGADGIHSEIRRQLFGDASPRYAGYTCWRGVARFRHHGVPPGHSIAVFGRGAQAGLFPCGGGRMYWFVTKNSPPGRDDGAAGAKRAILAAFDDWVPALREAVEATEEERIVKNDIVDRSPIRRWGRGRVTLLGDAAHPTTPNLAQGACQAIEDAVVLAHVLRSARHVADGLRLYERLRRRRTAMVTRQSWRLGKVFQWERPLGVRLRELGMASRLGRWRALAVLRLLLGYTAPELPSAPPAVRAR
jgi:2-polyprenyl-6-methoxyphenol hydroxylase-like FAD-dependent oxidoreductase